MFSLLPFKNLDRVVDKYKAYLSEEITIWLEMYSNIGIMNHIDVGKTTTIKCNIYWISKLREVHKVGDTMDGMW